MAIDNLTAEKLRDFLDYNPETGLFSRRKPSGTAKRGDIAGWVEPSGYIKISIGGSKYFAHRCAILYMTGEWPPHDVDHIDRNPSNNKYSNLRCATARLNMQNRKVKSGSEAGLLGVSFHRKANKFTSEIVDNLGVRHYLGLFASKEEASSAYLQAKRLMHRGFVK